MVIKSCSILRLNKKKQIICFFLFSLNLISSQNLIKGTIKTIDNRTIEGVNLIVKTKKEDKTIAYGITNKSGEFIIKINTSSDCILKISHLGYKTIAKNIEILSNNLNLGDIILIENKTELDEIILEAENSGILQKGDTTLYKVEKFLNGTEDNLKDIIDNLPGLGINEKGKITANGKEIDRLLIDGENLYKRQHQFATDNISSEMVKEIELIRNYKDFESIQQNDKTEITALNVKIKDNFKNRFTGFLEANLGYKDKYKFNSALFNFNKKVKFSIITNNNNLGDTPIGIEDYFSITDSKSKKTKDGNSKVIFSNLNDIPKFLTSGNNVTTKSTNFATISTIINPTEKMKIDFYGIFNNTNQTEDYFSETVLYTSQNPLELKEKIHTKENNYFGILHLKSIYKANENTVLTFNTNLNIDNTKQLKSIENETDNDLKFIEERNSPKKISYNSSFLFKKNINTNILSSNIYFDYNKFNDRKIIYSDGEFLDLNFNNNEFLINQLIEKETKETGFELGYKINKEKITMHFYSNSNLIYNDLFSNVINQLGFNNDLTLNRFLSSTGSDFTLKISKVINYTLGINYNYLSNKFNKTSSILNYFGFNTSIKVIFNSNNIGQLSYNYSSTISKIDNLLEQYIIKDYRNLILNENVKPNSFFPYHQINLTHFIFKPKAKFSFIFNASYNFRKKSIDNNIVNTKNITISKYKVIEKDQSFITFFFINKEFKNIPLVASNSFSFETLKKNYFQNNITTLFKTQNFSNIINIKSKFKKSFIHFNFGYKFSHDIYNNNGNKSKIFINQTSLGLNGVLSSGLTWKLNLNHTKYLTFDNQRKVFSFSQEFRFSKKKSNWVYQLTGNNILNLNNQNIIENRSNASYTEQRIRSILSGYILLSAKFKF